MSGSTRSKPGFGLRTRLHRNDAGGASFPSGVVTSAVTSRRIAGGTSANSRRSGVRHGHRERPLTGTFGTDADRRAARSVRRVGRRDGANGRTARLPAYQRRTRPADALIAGAYLAGPTRAACAAR